MIARTPMVIAAVLAMSCAPLLSGCITTAAYHTIEEGSRVEPRRWAAGDVDAIATVNGAGGGLAPAIRVRADDGRQWDLRAVRSAFDRDTGVFIELGLHAALAKGDMPTSVTPCALLVDRHTWPWIARMAGPDGDLALPGPVTLVERGLVLIDLPDACLLEWPPGSVGEVPRTIGDPLPVPRISGGYGHCWTIGLFFFPVAPFTIALDIALLPFEAFELATPP